MKDADNRPFALRHFSPAALREALRKMYRSAGSRKVPKTAIPAV